FLFFAGQPIEADGEGVGKAEVHLDADQDFANAAVGLPSNQFCVLGDFGCSFFLFCLCNFRIGFRRRPVDDVCVPWRRLMSNNIQHCQSDMLRIENGDTMHCPISPHVFVCNLPKLRVGEADAAKHGCFAILGNG
ncbi:MAG: hypothetical protein ABL878_13220, partial [Burkholderiales bacterium]